MKNIIIKVLLLLNIMLSIDEKFKEIDKQFDKISRSNKEVLDNALIKPIHEKFPFAQNGITAFIAWMGSGKSYANLKL